MGTENPVRSSYPLRPPAGTPFATAQSTTHFQSSVPAAVSEGSSFRHAPPVSSQFSTSPFPSGSSVGSEIPAFRPPPPGRYNAPLSPIPPSASYGSPVSGPQQFTSLSVAPTAGHSSVPPPTRPSMQTSYFTQPPSTLSTSSPFQQRGNAPPGAPTTFRSQQQGYVPEPPTTTPSGLSLGNTSHGLVEDFCSLSLGSVSGSFDTGLDASSLPRPLDGDGDVEPKALSEMFPMNCNSRYLRLATGGVPSSQSLASRWHLPLGVVVCPLAEAPPEEEFPIVNFTPTGIIRCRRCRTYVNPFVTFTDSGRKWRCNICSFLNDVQGDYFAPLDASGKRVDLDQRPELTQGSVEFIAPPEYMARPPMRPLYFFLIDVSTAATKSGMLEVMAQTVKSCLGSLPGYPRTQIGFITYDSTIHFYNMKSSLTQPQMMVMSDLDDIFIPLPDDLLVNLSESRSMVEAFLDSLPSMFQDNMIVESAFGPALKAALMIMSQFGGKLLIFQNTLPSLGVGRLRLRADDSRIYGTDKEHKLRVPEDPFYKQMAADMTKHQIAVNIYAFSDKYTDIASLGTLAKYTGGQVCYYPSFQATIHKDKLKHELARDLTRKVAWESVMRIRCGRGVHFTTYHGNFMLRSTDLLALPAVDCDKTYTAQLTLKETLLTTPTVYFQVALLYTSSAGERRVRVHTAAAPVVANLGEMYRLADTGAIMSLFSRLAIEKTLSHKLEDARNAVQLRIVKALREYRNLYSVQHRLNGRMIFPESLKFLPLYALALCKSMALRGGYADVQLDERRAAGFTMMALPVKKLLKLLYPCLFRVDEILQKGYISHATNSQTSSEADEFENIVRRLPLTAESLDTRGFYMFDDGFQFVLWFGRSISPDIAVNLLGEDFNSDYLKVGLFEHGNEMSRKLMRILQKRRESDPSYFQLCHLVRQGEQPKEGFFLLTNLVEDQVGGSNGYVDWILQLNRQVQQSV